MGDVRISAIVPTLDEEGWVGECVRTLTAADEVIVADGGSVDGTREEALAAGARVVAAPRGRGAQQRAGAAEATGDWLLFIHADTRLGAGWREELAAVDEAVVGGAFRFALAAPGRRFRWLEAGVALRCRVLAMPYGDQGLFVRRAAYERAGGMAPLPTLEDIDLVRRLRRLGPLAFLRTPALTSPRRFQAAGFLRPLVRNTLCLLLCGAGVPPARVAALFVDGRWGRSGHGGSGRRGPGAAKKPPPAHGGSEKLSPR